MTRRAPSAATPDDVLRYVAGYLEAHDGISPSFRDIAAGLGIYSLGKVSDSLAHLAELGLINRLPDRARAIAVLHPPAIPRTPTGEPLYFVRIP